MNSFIPKDRSGSYRPWQLKSLDGGSNPKSREKEDAERIKMINQQAYREGLAAGYEKGTARAAQEAVRLTEMANSLAQELAGLEHRIAEDLLRLALTLAQSLVRESLKIHPELVRAIVRDATHDLPPFSQGARIRIHPDDAALLAQHLGQDPRGEWMFLEDTSITRGGCKIETTTCEVDATLEARWQKLTQALAQDHSWSA